QRLPQNKLRRTGRSLAFCDRNFCFIAGPVVMFFAEIGIGEQIMRQPVVWVGKHRLLQSRSRRGIILPLQACPAEQRERLGGVWVESGSSAKKGGSPHEVSFLKIQIALQKI